MNPLRVFLVDENQAFLRSAEALLSDLPGVAVIGRACSGGDALDLVPRFAPDLLLMDCSLHEVSGLEVTRRLKARSDSPHVVLWSLHDHPQYQAAAEAAGADAFVLKHRLPSRLIALIQALFPNHDLNSVGKRKASPVPDEGPTFHEGSGTDVDRYRDLLDQAGESILCATAEGQLLWVNRCCRDALGYEPEVVPHLLFWDLFHPDYRPRCRELFHAALASGQPERIEAVLVSRHGRPIWVEGTVRPRRTAADAREVCVVLRDVTEGRRQQERLQQAERLVVLGRLAGAVVHDFNNLLSAVLGASDLLARKRPAGDSERALLEHIYGASEEALAFTRHLTAMCRRPASHPYPVNVNDCLANVERVLRRLFGTHIELETFPATAPATALADAGQVEQVLLNLALDACDALPEGGRLILGTSTESRDSGECWVILTVCAIGRELTETVCAHGIEPTAISPVVRPTSLGLAVAQEVVERGGGRLEVVSGAGWAAAFKVCLPRLDSKNEKESDKAPPE
jgi:PAS domain S-box-containing protein